MSLEALQQDFRSWLAAADAGAADHLPLVDRRGLGVYQNNYRAALLTCLEDSYPQTLAWIGREAFSGAAIEHIDRVPPHSWTLDEYAEGFPGTLVERFPHDLEVGELARFELSLADAFIAPDAEPLTCGDLASVAWDEAQLELVPSASFLAFVTNAAEIWSALDGEYDLPHARLLPEPARLIVWRQDFACCFQPLDADEAILLPRMASGLPFETMCEHLVERYGADHGVELAGQLLARWTQAGLLCHLAR